MSTDQAKKARFDTALKRAIFEGKAGRTEIIVQLAGLTLEELAKVPPSAIAALGPGGLAALTTARGDLPAGLALAEQRIGKSQERTPAAGCPFTRKSRINIPVFVLGLLVLVAGPVFDALRPFASQMMDIGWRSVNATTWPRCTRLDAYVDGCLYRVGGGATTLGDIAGRLEIPVALLMSSNRHIPADTRQALSRGTDVVVWRGKLGLGGPRQ